jgi:hypothetical protein
MHADTLIRQDDLGISLPALVPPLAERLLRHDTPAFAQEFFHVAGAATQAGVKPHAVAEKLGGKKR